MRSTLPRSVDGYGVTPRDGDKKEAFFVFRLKSTLVEKRGENRNIIYDVLLSMRDIKRDYYILE